MEKAIKKAQESGYSYNSLDEKSYGDILLEVEFWKCLGKTEGWQKQEKKWVKLIKAYYFPNASSMNS